MYRIESMTFERFVTRKYIIFIINYQEALIIIKLHKEVKACRTDSTFSSFYLSNILKSLFGIFSSSVWLTRRHKYFTKKVHF